MKTILTALVLLLNIAIFSIADVSAQTKTFKWENPACSLEGRYDPIKYSEKQLKDTSELISSAGAIPLFTRTSVFKYEDIVKLSVEDLDAEYKTVSKKLRNLDVVKGPYWEGLKRAKIRETDEFYQLNRVKIQAYTNPAMLKKTKKAPFCNDFYVEPLIKGGDYLRVTWLKQNMDSRQTNGDPARVKREFEAAAARTDWEEIARVDILTFGWGNCANKTISYVEGDGTAGEKFKKLFTNVKEECDEP